MKKFLKRKLVLALLAMIVLIVLFVGTALAGDGVIHVVSSPLHYSGTGWGGWSCPAGTVVVAGGYEPADHVVLVSEAAKEGSVSGFYPNYPHYIYTPPEEGWVVQNGGVSATLTIWVDCAPAPEVLPEYICHATESPANPFVKNTPNNIGQLLGHVGLGHQSGEDIIPPIPVFLPSGQNWDTVGQAIWENGCEIPEPPHDYELVFDFRNECEGNNYYRIMLTDFGQYVSTLYHSGFFVWSEPFLLESRTFGPFDLGEHGTFPAVTLDEPEICQAVHELAFVHTKDCVDWSYGYLLDGVETIIASGEWVDQLEQEKIFVSFEVFLPAGEIASRTPIFGPWYLVEPTEDDSGKCYVTCDETVLNRSWTEEILTPEGAVQVTTFFEYIDSLDPEVVCRVTKEVEIVYESCLNAESTYEVPGEWTEWFTVNGPNKERSRTVEVFDGETDFKCGEYTKYDRECFADDFIWVWQGCGCSIRDRTYELYQFGSPPLVAQRAYCGCDFSCIDEGAWNDSGYVNNCQGEDYTFWDELPKWCGFTSCE